MLRACPELLVQRAELVDFLIKLDTKMSPEGYAAIATLLPAVPPGGYRDELILRVAVFLSTVAKTRAEQGDWQTALKVVWPMISSQPMPAKLTPDAAMNLTGGWVPLKAHQPAANREQIVEALQAIGRSEFAADGSDAQLVGLWVASEYLRQEPADWNVAAYTTDKRLQLLDNLASMSRPAATRKKGDTLSVADTMQEKIIKSLASELVSEEQRQRLVGAIIGQVNRYKAAGDLEAGMKPFVGVLLVAGLPPRGAGDRRSRCRRGRRIGS